MPNVSSPVARPARPVQPVYGARVYFSQVPGATAYVVEFAPFASLNGTISGARRLGPIVPPFLTADALHALTSDFFNPPPDSYFHTGQTIGLSFTPAVGAVSGAGEEVLFITPPRFSFTPGTVYFRVGARNDSMPEGAFSWSSVGSFTASYIADYLAVVLANSVNGVVGAANVRNALSLIGSARYDYSATRIPGTLATFQNGAWQVFDTSFVVAVEQNVGLGDKQKSIEINRLYREQVRAQGTPEERPWRSSLVARVSYDSRTGVVPSGGTGQGVDGEGYSVLTGEYTVLATL